jgi:hypothetical protein
VKPPLIDRIRAWLIRLDIRRRLSPLARLPRRLTPSGLHETLTVIAPIVPERVDALRALLARIDEEECRKAQCPLPGVSGVHIARWSILPRAVRASGVTAPETLVFWTVFDGTRDSHLEAVTTKARARLDEIYRHCRGYPGALAGTKDVERYLTEHASEADWVACFDGTPARSLEQVTKENLLHEKLREFLTRDWGDTSLSHIHLAARQWAASDDAYRWALQEPDRGHAPKLAPFGWAAALVLLVVCPLLFGVGTTLQVTASAIAIAVIAGVVWFIALTRAERSAQRSFVPASRHWFDRHSDDMRLRENEDSGMNRLTILTDVHPGWVRALTIRAVLWITNFQARRVLDGKLQGVETIHFAQWRLVDGGRRLLFMSNYDHRWDDYFRAFSENAAPGVNAIWSNTVGFPPTARLIGGGSRDLPQFQKSARTYQIPTDVWYFGYPKRWLTTRRINENTRIRVGLARHLTPPEVKAWLELVYADAS